MFLRTKPHPKKPRNGVSKDGRELSQLMVRDGGMRLLTVRDGDKLRLSHTVSRETL